MNLKRTQFRVKEFYSVKKKDLVFRLCVKDLIFIYYGHEKSLDFGRFIMPGNKLLKSLSYNEPWHEISNNVAFDMCRLGRASAASF